MLKIQKYKKMKNELNMQTKQILKKVTFLYLKILLVFKGRRYKYEKYVKIISQYSDIVINKTLQYLAKYFK